MFNKAGRLLLPICILSLPLAASADFHLLNETTAQLNRISGPGADRSALTNRTGFMDTLNLSLSGNGEELQYHLNLGLKAVNDEYYDSQDYSLTALRGNLKYGDYALAAGDIFESFSKYTLGSSLKGVSAIFNKPKSLLPRITLLGGYAQSRWDQSWVQARTQQTGVGGVRIEQPFGKKAWLAANYVYGKDTEVMDGMPYMANGVWAVDGEYRPIKGLKLETEVAGSGSATEVSSDETLNINGMAYRFKATGDGAPSKVVLEYEKVDPDFISLLGASSPDREKARAQWRYDLNRQLRLTGELLWYHDNLENQLAATTQTWRPSLEMRLRKMEWRPSAVWTAEYRLDLSRGDVQDMSNHFIKMSWDDRFGPFDSTTNIGVTLYDSPDTREETEYLLNTSLSWRKNLGPLLLRSSLMAGGWQLENELQDITGTVFEYSIRQAVDLPKWRLNTQLSFWAASAESGKCRQ